MIKKDWKYVIYATLLELCLIIASLMIALKFDILNLSYTIIGFALIVLVVLFRIALESKYS